MVLPTDFEIYTRQLMGESLYAQFADALDSEAPASIRLNPFKTATAAPVNGADKVPWCRYGYYLSGRPAFTFDPLLHAGAYYVQEAASMFVDHVARQVAGDDSPLAVLDMCAAPGGKSTCVMGALPAGSIMFSNEPVRSRAMVLAENITKFGKEGMTVTNNYPRDYRKSGMVFDMVVADVPCSGEGMFRKDPGAVAEWSTANVARCAKLQREIVADAWHCLRPGGIMIYSTCTFNAYEDEENAAWIASELGADFVEVDTSCGWGITGALKGAIPAYRFIPGVSRSEGLFVAVLRKHGNGKASATGELSRLGGKALNVVYDGVRKPILKGKQAVPDHSEAMSHGLQREKYPQAELTYRQAIDYLRRESLQLPDGTPLGIVLVTYRNVPLGFVKNLGNRANNLYPQEWRIKSTHIPDVENILTL